MDPSLYYLDQASSFAGDMDNLLLTVTVIVAPWFFLAEAILFWFIFKFKHRDGVKSQYITGDKHSEKKFIELPHILIILCDVVLIYGAVTVWYQIKQDLPKPDRKIKIVVQQWAWTFIHPGKDGRLDTFDDIVTIDQLHLEKDKTYNFVLESKDVLHNFSVPVFRLQQDAVPGRQITGWFKPTMTGKYEVQCAEMCGIGHSLMYADMFIHESADYETWQNNPEDFVDPTLPPEKDESKKDSDSKQTTALNKKRSNSHG